MRHFQLVLLIISVVSAQLVRADPPLAETKNQNLSPKALPRGAVLRLKGSNLAVTGHVACLAFTPDNRTVALGTNKGVQFWNIAAGRKMKEWTQFPYGGVSALAFSTKGNLLATVNGSELFVQIWDVQSGKLKLRTTEHQRFITALAFSPKDDLLAVATAGSGVYLWKLQNGKAILVFQTERFQSVNVALAFAPDGQTLAILDQWTVVSLWDIKTGKRRQQFKRLQLSRNPGPNTHPVLAFSPDGHSIALGGLSGRRIAIWSCKGLGSEWRPPQKSDHFQLSIFSPMGPKLIACGGRGFTFTAYSESWSFATNGSWSRGIIAVSPARSFLPTWKSWNRREILAGWGYHSEETSMAIQTWQLATEAIRQPFEMHEREVG